MSGMPAACAVSTWVGYHPSHCPLYFFGKCLFLCDYVFLENGHMRYNPFGPAGDTVAGGNHIRDILQGRDLTWVCGVNYVVPYGEWLEKFQQMPLYVGY